MKHLILILAIIAFGFTANAQRGTYGTLTPVSFNTGAIYGYVAGVVTAKTADTLSNVDTGLVRWTFSNSYNLLFDYTITKLTGTPAGTLLLQGSVDGSTWNTITGSTTYCAGCIGASGTITNTAGTKHYQWVVPYDAGTNYKYWQVQAITSGTTTVTYSGTAQYSY